MIRLFTKNSTGVAPDGRWYPGDINALQDAVAALLDFTQTIGLQNLQVGDAGLQIQKYGTGEIGLTASLRVYSILRALGGVLPGQFTTTARNAIASGSRPFGLLIYNTTNARFEVNAGSDATPNWQPVGITQSDMSRVDLYANRGSASSYPAGSEFTASDTLGRWRSTGSVWELVAQGRPKVTTATMNAAPFTSPYDGQEVELVDASDSRYAIHLKYNNAVSDSIKWMALGGMISQTDDNEDSWANDASFHTLSGISITIPRNGIYRMKFSHSNYGNGSTAVNQITSQVANATPTQKGPQRTSQNEAGHGTDPDWTIVGAEGDVQLAEGDVLTMRVQRTGGSNSTTTKIRHKHFELVPIRLA